MVKRKVVEVVEEYNDSGNLIRKVTTETTEDDDTLYPPYYGVAPDTYNPNQPYTTPGADCVSPRDFTTICNTINGANGRCNG